jgi:hypothetical protein
VQGKHALDLVELAGRSFCHAARAGADQHLSRIVHRCIDPYDPADHGAAQFVNVKP